MPGLQPLEPTLKLAELDAMANADTEKRKELLADLYAKCDDLDAYAETLYDKIYIEMNGVDEAQEVANQLLREKAYILSCVAIDVKKVLDKAHPESFDAKELAENIESAALKAVPSNLNPIILTVHRQPVLRWLNEIMAMIATLFVGTLIKTGINIYETYSANPDDFSFSKVPFGFFSNTESVNRMGALVTAVDALESVNRPAL